MKLVKDGDDDVAGEVRVSESVSERVLFGRALERLPASVDVMNVLMCARCVWRSGGDVAGGVVVEMVGRRWRDCSGGGGGGGVGCGGCHSRGRGRGTVVFSMSSLLADFLFHFTVLCSNCAAAAGAVFAVCPHHCDTDTPRRHAHTTLTI